MISPRLPFIRSCIGLRSTHLSNVITREGGDPVS
jgi:hypothetical protein